MKTTKMISKPAPTAKEKYELKRIQNAPRAQLRAAQARNRGETARQEQQARKDRLAMIEKKQQPTVSVPTEAATE